jgi:hypothetical protein
MSGLKPQPLTEFYRSLRARGVTTDDLGARLDISGSTVRKLFGLLKRRRGLVWRQLQAHLTDREKQLLADVEQCSAWNIRQSGKRPKWNAEKVAGLAETYTGKFEDERDRLRSTQTATP